jgi:hypothetical protein
MNQEISNESYTWDCAEWESHSAMEKLLCVPREYGRPVCEAGSKNIMIQKSNQVRGQPGLLRVKLGLKT